MVSMSLAAFVPFELPIRSYINVGDGRYDDRV